MPASKNEPPTSTSDPTNLASSPSSQQIEPTFHQQLRQAYWRERFTRAEALIERAKDRDELPEEVNAHFLVEAAIGPTLVRANATDQPFDDQFPEQIVALLLCGVRNTKDP